MKNFLIIFGTLFLFSCQSTKKFNQQLTEPIEADKLQKDVDYSYKKLKQLHPKLYWYISKEKLDYKFDSLKKSIQQPMTGLAFYKELSQVVKNIGQGHLGVSPSLPKFTKKEIQAINKKGQSAFSQFDFEYIDNKLIITKNRSRHKIQAHTEVVSINSENPSDLLLKFSKRMASDGFNKTFFKRYLGKYFGTFFTYEKGMIQESLQLVVKFEGKDSLFVVKRDTFGSNSNQKKLQLSKKVKKDKAKFNSKYGFNKDTKTFNRALNFVNNDSITAIMSIKGFSNGSSHEFYEDAFNILSVANTKNLIIDLRNNGGGRLNEIADLYSYLVSKPFVFIDNYEVVSRTSFLHMNYFKGSVYVTKFFKILGAPIFYPLFYFKTRKEASGTYLSNRHSKQRNPKPTSFKGKIYVLINGGSFSASSIISSNLKSNQRAFFVGEETGGAYNGTVAAQMPLVQLPNSKVNLRIGLALVSATGKTNIEGRGIFPDKEILPTLEDRKSNIDPELNWILEDIRREKDVEILIKPKNN
ncbi:S41 family peptidase [Flavobacterium sp.]|jgi:hypothetical protein|uniref:S41 family peptidase n=1 Tax=Flavobacterium sp. TaxID=239 RepID=UPI0037BF78B4